MRYSPPEPAVRSIVLYRAADSDPTVEAQLTAGGDLRVLSIHRAGVWEYSDIDTVAWWSWHEIGRADVPRLAGGGDPLEAVRVAVTPEPGSEIADDQRVGDIFQRFDAWVQEHGVRFVSESYDEHAG